MKTLRVTLVLTAAMLLAPAAPSQQPPQPGPEHAKLKAQEGTWDAVMNMGGQESKATQVSKMELGGLWLVSTFTGDFEGQKFEGRGLDTYDPSKKKYVSVWVDSMSTAPMISEGTYDKDGKVLTMKGEGPGPDGNPMKLKMTTEHKDKDTMLFTMYFTGPDGSEAEMFTITYKRRK